MLLLLFFPTISPTLCFSQRSAEGGFYDTKQAAHAEALNATDMTTRTAAEGVLVAAATKAGSTAGTKVAHRFRAGNLEWFGFIALIIVGVVMTTGDTTTTSNH
jgi:hypothetical protein